VKETAIVRHLDIAMEWGLYAVIFFLPISMPIVSIALLCSAAIWGLKGIVTKKLRWRRTPLDLPIGVFVAISGVSILGSPDRFISLYNYAYLMGHYILTYYLIVNSVQSFEQVKRLLKVLFISALGTAVYGFYQYIHGVDISQYRWVDGEQFPDLHVRVFSTMGNPNIYAGYLVVVIALAIGMMLAARQWKSKFAYVGLIGTLSACLALTYCRGSWLSFLGVLAILGLMRSKKFLWLIIIAPLAARWVNPMLLERLISIANPVDSSSALRIALWESSFAMLLEHPFLGIGWGAYWMVYPSYDFFITDSATTIYHAHNMFLHIGAELGFMGLAAFLWLLISVLKMTLSMYRRCLRPDVCGAALGLAAAFCGIILSGFTDYVMFNIQMSILFWALMGLTTVISCLIISGTHWDIVEAKDTHISK
jgi:putative inorganic carbon (hco3(-)) transporter